ncbi:hypothetical protein BS78_06G010000 [Paspalum vaginatum]|nr:hypothetical protein BS78_06G010000 [Paspalum vaginatum]KAJ1269857.1 hypothetical protein BS78_06G010000 [Paspalum vaginatum]KAJ1269858.1 hypothetical protein BS78_06G010000 [Paspalum vaginatum]
MARYFRGNEFILCARRHNKQLQELAEELDHIKGIVDANSKGVIDEHLWQLKDDIHDAEELLLDMLQHEPGRTNQNLKRLDKLLYGIPKLHRSLQECPENSQYSYISRQITGPQPAKEKLFGYGKEYTTLLSSLVPDKLGTCGVGDAHQVVALIGHGGMGKTQLARWAFNHEEKIRANFDLRIWVCVYAKFTETDLLREICKSAAGSDADVAKMGVTRLQQKLKEIIVPQENKNKRYLLVLDDVCNDESATSELGRRKTWDVVLAPFKKHGGSGSRILMTTRAEICSATLDAGTRILLNGTNTDAITLLLKKTAFGDEHVDLPKKLNEVIHQNVGKLHGSPLAAEKVGSILQGNKDSEKWKNYLNNDLHEDLFQAHLSSYQDLPPHLRRCFSFCSIFPRKWEFEPEKLVNMWVAHGFVEVSAGTRWMAREDMARGYFNALLKRSFFHLKESSTPTCGRPGGYYVIHEDVHSMLQRVTSNYCLRIDGPLEAAQIHPKIRHLSITTDNVHQLGTCPPGWLKKLRTLLIYQKVVKDDGSSSQASIISVLDNGRLWKFSDLRVLDISDTCIAQLPHSIRKLRQLRYLGLPRTIREIGADVNKLIYLQTLEVKRTYCKLAMLPGDMSRLINLRHLDVDMECIAQIGGIGNMKMLQGSVEFDASNRKKGHTMRELEELNSLGGTLAIKGLEAVESKKKAEIAHLEKKGVLEVLKLEWGHRSEQQAKSSAASGSDSIVLAGLRPHPNLRELHITRYQGTMCPGWLADARALQNLRSLYLRNCRKLVALPPVGDLPCLKVLEVNELCSVESINDMFCSSGTFKSLEKMVLHDMPALLAWNAASASADAEPAADGAATPPILFPQLRKVEIVDCPKLASLSGLLCCRASLGVLCVKRCPAVTATFRRSSFPSLVNPDIQGCPGLQFQG